MKTTPVTTAQTTVEATTRGAAKPGAACRASPKTPARRRLSSRFIRSNRNPTFPRQMILALFISIYGTVTASSWFTQKGEFSGIASRAALLRPAGAGIRSGQRSAGESSLETIRRTLRYCVCSSRQLKMMPYNWPCTSLVGWRGLIHVLPILYTTR